MDNLTIQYTGKDFSLTDKNFFEGLSKQIVQGEKDIPWKQKKQYRLEVSKKAEGFVLSLMDVKANQEIDRVKLHANRSLVDLETRLLSDLAKTIQKYTIHAAMDIQKDFKDAQALARKIDPADDEFNEGYLKDLRNVALGNIKDIGRMKERGV